MKRRVNWQARRVVQQRANEIRYANPKTFNDSILSGAIYSLQSANYDGRWTARIRELLAEKDLRKAMK